VFPEITLRRSSPLPTEAKLADSSTIRFERPLHFIKEWAPEIALWFRTSVQKVFKKQLFGRNVSFRRNGLILGQ
jgi:hypothetical protein